MSAKTATGKKPRQPTAKEINEIVALTQGGHPEGRICRALGITQLELKGWLAAGRVQKADGNLRKFYDEYQKASALGEIANEEMLKKHAKDNPAAAFRLIERLEQRAKKEDDDLGEPLANTQWEAFCQSKATGMSASDSYRSVYGTNAKSVESLASRLMASTIVKNRIAQLQKGGVRTTHLTIAEKRLIYAQEATDRKNSTRDRLYATQMDSVLAGHIKEADRNAVNVTVNVATLSEERRADLIARKRASIERRIQLRAQPLQLTNGNGNGTNGRH